MNATRPILPADQAALLAAVASRPDDDTPRLVYADWLDDHGDPDQAAFVRDSVELARLAPGSSRQRALRPRVEAVARENGARWLEEVGITALAEYDRGFAEDVYYLGARGFLAEVDDLFGRVPVRSLTVHAPGGDELEYNRLVPVRSMIVVPPGGDALGFEGCTRLARTPGLSRVRALTLSGHAGTRAAGWRSLFRSPYLTGLRRLTLTGCGLGPVEARALARCPALAGLTVLDLTDNALGVRGSRAILASPYLTRLTEFWAGGNAIEEEAESYAGETGEDVLAALERRFGSGLHLTGEPDDYARD